MSEETNQNETPAPSAAPAAPAAPASAAASTPSAPTVQPATPAQPAAPAEAEASVQTDFVGASESSHSAAQQPTPHSPAQPVAPAKTQPLPSQQVPPAPAAACQQPAAAQPAAAAQPTVTPQANFVGASESSHSAAQQPTPHSAAQPSTQPTQPTPNPVQPTYQQPTCQQQPAQPVAAPAPLTQLSGGMKFGWFVIGVLVGIPGILIAWLANVDKLPQVKADAVKFSAIGLVVWAVLWALACLGFLSIVAAVLSSLFGDFSSSYGMYY